MVVSGGFDLFQRPGQGCGVNGLSLGEGISRRFARLRESGLYDGFLKTG